MVVEWCTISVANSFEVAWRRRKEGGREEEEEKSQKISKKLKRKESERRASNVEESSAAGGKLQTSFMCATSAPDASPGCGKFCK